MNEETLIVTETQGPPQPTGPKPPPSCLDRGSVIGRYVVLEFLGGGGMGVVYAAYDPELDRKIALKLLRVEAFAQAAREEAQQRLLREAQALAKLSHPNVVGVHDIGLTGDQVFIAMEHIQGQDLQKWLKDEQPPWRRVVEVFVQAGGGLEAAHRAGLLHRDFKPANVLLGDDGRARVADFGLARPTAPSAGSREEAGNSEASAGDDKTLALQARPGSGSMLDRRLTRPGRRIGTPAFMAPEQLTAGLVDARSDQFSFCVALYVALYGQAPFDRRQDLLTEKLVPLPKGKQVPGRQVPGWLEKVVIRGLSIDPEHRFDNMGQLLAALDRRPLRRRAFMFGALVMVALLALAMAQPWRPVPCHGAEDHLVGVWDASRKAALAATFSRSSQGFAETSKHGTLALLDAYATDWVDGRKKACEATFIRKEQSETLLDLRMACLDRRLGEMGALVDLLIDAEPSMLKQSGQAAARLGSLTACADARALTALVPLPEDPMTRARVDGLQPKVDELKGLFHLGQNQAAWAAAEALAEPVDAVGYAPLEAEALLFTGLAAGIDDRPDAAKEAHSHGLIRADAGSHDRARIRNLLALAWLHSNDSGDASEHWLEMAEGALERTGDSDLWANFYQVKAVRVRKAGDYGRALVSAEEGVRISRRFWGADDLKTGRCLSTLGKTQQISGHFEEALKTLTEVERIHRVHLGAQHPEVAYSAQSRGEVLKSLGRYEEALSVLESALGVLEANLGPEHTRLNSVLSSLGNTHSRLGHLDQAELLLQRVARQRATHLGEEHPLHGAALHDVALVVWNRRDLDRAGAILRQATKIFLDAWGPEHPMTLIARLNLSRFLLENGEVSVALAHLEPSLKAALQRHGEQHPTAIGCRLAHGEALLASGETLRGHRDIEIAARLAEERRAEPWLMALIRFAQARSAAARGDRSVARERTAEARRLFQSMAGAGEYNLARLESWSDQTLSNDRT